MPWSTDEPQEKRRRGYASISAIDPRDGGQWEVLVSNDKMDWVARQGTGPAKELADTVRWSLLHPRAIFRGIRDVQHDVVEDDWLCYVATPTHCYDRKTGERRPPWRGEVFMVFLTDERVVYGWYWHPCDEQNPHLPADCDERFRERLI